MRISDWSSDVCSSDLGMVDLDQRQQLGHAVEIGREARHKAALSVRPAMPPMIDRIDGIAPTGQTFRNMRVAPGMFGIAVREQHDGARALFGKPVGDVEVRARPGRFGRSEEHTSELQSLMRISYAVFCLKKKQNTKTT